MPAIACEMVWLVRSPLITAMPSAAPIWRTVVFAPLAAPDRASGISESTTLVSCELAKPMAMPNTIRPGRSDTKVVSRGHRRPDGEEPGRFEDESDAHHVRHADAARESGADLAAHNDRDPGREEPESAVHGGEVNGVLQEHGQHEEEAELSHGEDHRGEQAVAKATMPQLTELEQRVARGSFLPPLEHVERAEQHECERDRDRHRRQAAADRRDAHAGDGEVVERAPPAVAGGLAEPEHEQEHPRGDEERAGHVDAFPVGGSRAASHQNSSAPRMAAGATITLIRNAQRHE